MKRARKSSGKRQKVLDNDDRNVDRLSALPDGVICHILSFLPTQNSVQTSILAKRWTTLWAHVPVLDFNCYEFGRSQAMSFPSIVCTVLLRHKVESLNTFRLTYTGDDDVPCYELETCIATVVERNVQNLYLHLRVVLPRCCLTCKTLIVLTMCRGVSIPPTAPISLPNLKKLHLYFLDCEVDFTRLISGCPVLEELIIKGTRCRDPRGCSISSPTLKRLTIILLLDINMFNNPDYMVTINTPALTYLKVLECSSKYISISLCTSLVEADICIDSLCEPDHFYSRCLLKLLDSIRNVKCLSISAHCGKIWDGPIPGSFAKFGNLTKLKLRANWFLVTKFLESADRLQVLTIVEVEWHSKHRMEPNEERCVCLIPVEEPSECLLHFLRTVRIDDFRCTEQGINMVRYILRNARVLERMEIYCPQLGVEKKFDAIRKISIFPRESKKCELHFS